MSERSGRRDDRRPPRDDNRNHKTRYEQDRSRSPPRRERRDDRRRDRSPPRGPSSRNGPPSRSDRDRDYQRSRESNGGPPKGRSGYGDRQPRDFSDSKTNGAGANGPHNRGGGIVKQEEVKMEIDENEDEETAMRRIMGFSDFKTTKNTKVPGNDKNYAVHKVKKAEYRQYMNRVGGFNRPLDAM